MHCYVGKSVFYWLYLYAPFWSHFSASPLCTEVTTLLNFSFIILILYFVVFTTCGYMLTFVSVLLSLLVTGPTTIHVLGAYCKDSGDSAYSCTRDWDLLQPHNQDTQSDQWGRKKHQAELEGILVSLPVLPKGPHRVHSLPPALNEIKSTVFLTREAFWDLAIFIGGRWHIGTFFPQNSTLPEQKRQVFTINQIVYTTVLAGWYSRYNLISW